MTVQEAIYKMQILVGTHHNLKDEAGEASICIDMKDIQAIELLVEKCKPTGCECVLCGKQYPEKYIANDGSGICVNCMIMGVSSKVPTTERGL